VSRDANAPGGKDEIGDSLVGEPTQLAVHLALIHVDQHPFDEFSAERGDERLDPISSRVRELAARDTPAE